MLGEPCLQWLQPPAGAADPVRQGRTIQLDTLPGKDLALSIQGKMIAVFGDNHVSQKSRRREALGDRALRSRCLVDGPAGPAAVARPANANDPQPCWYVVEHLARGLADQMEIAPTATAGLMIEVEPNIFALKMGGHPYSHPTRLKTSDAFPMRSTR